MHAFICMPSHTRTPTSVFCDDPLLDILFSCIIKNLVLVQEIKKQKQKQNKTKKNKTRTFVVSVTGSNYGAAEDIDIIPMNK